MKQRCSRSILLSALLLIGVALNARAFSQGGPTPPPPSNPPGNGGSPAPQTIPDTNWRLSPLFSGTTAWTAVDQYGPPRLMTKGWSDMNHNVGYSSRLAYWAFDQRGSTFTNWMDGRVTSGGTLDFYLEYLATPPANFRSFWAIYASGAASTEVHGTASASSNPSKTTFTNAEGSNSYSYGTKIVEKSGDSFSLQISFFGQAFQPKGVYGEPIAQLAGSLRALAHPAFNLLGAEPGNKSRQSLNLRDGSGHGTLDIAARWQGSANGGWAATREYQIAQELYSSAFYKVSGAAQLVTSTYPSGSLQFFLGGDTTSVALNQTSNLEAKIEDYGGDGNPTVHLKTMVRWHKPVENPELVPGSLVTSAESVNVDGVDGILQPNGSPTSAVVTIRFTRPGASWSIDPLVATVLSSGGTVLSVWQPELGAVLALAGLTADKFGPKPESLSVAGTTIFACKWPSGQYMGYGIDPTRTASEHWITGVDSIVIPFKAATYNCELYGGKGYVGQGNVRTFEELPDWKYRGVFQPMTSGPPPPPGGGGGGGPATRTLS